MRLLRRCVTAGWVDFHGGDRPVALVTAEGREVIHDRRPARLLLPPKVRMRPADEAGRPARQRGARAPDDAPMEELDAAGLELFEALRAFRIEEARRQQVPPYVIASDRTLRHLAVLRPDSPATLELVHGIGPAKAERYGTALLGIVERCSASE